MKKLVSIGFLVLGAVIGISVGMALGQTVNCSHVSSFCQGTNEADNISGWENTNNIFAKGGRDQVWAYGSFDEDYARGEFGNDSYLIIGGGAGVYGQSQNDHLSGEAGEDYVQGDYGNDAMYGGEH